MSFAQTLATLYLGILFYAVLTAFLRMTWTEYRPRRFFSYGRGHLINLDLIRHCHIAESGELIIRFADGSVALLPATEIDSFLEVARAYH